MSSVPRQRRWWWLHLGVLLAVRALAAPEPSKVVLLEAVGEPADVAALRTSLEDWLRAMQLELKAVDALPSIQEPSFARVRAVWTETSCIVEVYSREGVLRRRKELPRGGPPLLISESAALIAQAGVQEVSIEEKKRAPLPAPEAALTAPPTVEVPVDQPPFGLRASVFGQGRVYGAEHPVVFGFGGEVSASFGDASWRPGVSLLLGYQGPLTEETSAFSIQLQTMQVRLLPTVKHRLGASFEVELGLGGGLDLLIARTTATAYDPRSVAENRVDPAPFFSASALLRWNLARSTSLFLRAFVDVDPARRRYVTNILGERESHLVPWIGRPALQLGFTFDILSRSERAP